MSGLDRLGRLKVNPQTASVNVIHTLKQRLIRQRARQWHVRLHSGEATEVDRSRHAEWLREDPSHQRAYDELDHALRRIDRTAAAFSEADLDAMMKPGFAASRTGRAGLQAAAAIAVLAVCAGLLFVLATGRAPSTQVLETAIAETKSVRLPDGSSVVLGGGSRVELRFGIRLREVLLADGEAYFDVAKQRYRPFHVSASGLEVTVRGTRFDVQKRVAGARVSVAEGVVSVSETGHGGAVDLVAGQAVEVDAERGMSRIMRVDANLVGAWRRGELLYADTALETVLADLNRYSAQRFQLGDASAGELRVTGMFYANRVDDAIRSISAVLPVAVTTDSRGVVVVSSSTPHDR